MDSLVGQKASLKFQNFVKGESQFMTHKYESYTYNQLISRIYGTKLHEIARKMLTEKPSKRPTATELVKLFSDLPETLN